MHIKMFVIYVLCPTQMDICISQKRSPTGQQFWIRINRKESCQSVMITQGQVDIKTDQELKTKLSFPTGQASWRTSKLGKMYGHCPILICFPDVRCYKHLIKCQIDHSPQCQRNDTIKTVAPVLHNQVIITSNRVLCYLYYWYIAVINTIPFWHQVSEDMFSILSVKQCVTSVYQSNGQHERTNPTIKRALSKYCNDKQNDWDKHLKGVVQLFHTLIIKYNS